MSRSSNIAKRLENYSSLSKQSCRGKGKESTGNESGLKFAASAAAGIGVAILCPLPAEAAIQYSGPQNLPINANNNYIALDIDGNGIYDFNFNFNSFIDATQSFRSVNMAPEISGNGWIDVIEHGDPARLSVNYNVQTALPNTDLFAWDSPANEDTLAGTSFGNTYDTFGDFNGQRGYIGVRFTSPACDNGNYHYGWIQFETTLPPAGNIIDWAYESSCNTPILTGDLGNL